MRRQHFLVAAAGAALLAAVLPASAGPGDMPVSQFVANCQSPDDSCGEIVHDVLENSSPFGGSCSTGLSDNEAAKKIAEWLNDRPQYRERSAANGITAAAADLWDC